MAWHSGHQRHESPVCAAGSVSAAAAPCSRSRALSEANSLAASSATAAHLGAGRVRVHPASSKRTRSRPAVSRAPATAERRRVLGSVITRR